MVLTPLRASRATRALNSALCVLLFRFIGSVVVSLSASKYLPVIHPGEILLEEFIKPMELKLAAVSRATGIPASRLTEITKCRRGLTAETALRLARFFGTSAAFWIGLQAEHDLEVAERAVGAKIRREVISMAS
jgi:addiction module HigA family antidote